MLSIYLFLFVGWLVGLKQKKPRLYNNVSNIDWSKRVLSFLLAFYFMKKVEIFDIPSPILYLALRKPGITVNVNI